jgi:hypothetical protein
MNMNDTKEANQDKPYRLNASAKGIIIAASSGIVAALTASLALLTALGNAFPFVNSNLIINLATVAFAVIGLVVAIAFVIPNVTARARKIGIAVTVLAVTGISTALYISIAPKTDADGKTTEFILCIADRKDLCLSAAQWAPCGTDFSVWPRQVHPKECARSRAEKLSDVPGGMCGFLTVRIVCQSKP